MTQTDVHRLQSFPAERTCPFSPPSEYSDLQEHQPVAKVRLRSGLDAWMLTRHQHVRAGLDDARLSSDERIEGYPHLYDSGGHSPLAGTFMRIDGDDHRRIRRMLTRHFTVAKAQQLRPRIVEVVQQCIDDLVDAGPGADLVQHLALAVPSTIICDVLGVPHADRRVFENNSRAMIDVKSTPDEVMGAFGAIFGYLDGLVAAKEEQPGDDLISALVRDELVPGNVDRQELVTMLLILLVAGHETTSTMIGLGVLAMIEHQDQLELLRERPELWAGAVDELLRHQTIAQAPVQRVAVEPLEIGGQRIEAGEGVLAVMETANRDPRAFNDPDRLDVTRNARNHVAFSSGPHQCLGQALARLELELTYSMLFERLPELRTAVPLAEIEMRPPTVGLYGVNELRVTW